MVQATYTPDMFNEKTGKLTVTFDIFQPVTQTVNSIEAGQVRRFTGSDDRHGAGHQRDSQATNKVHERRSFHSGHPYVIYNSIQRPLQRDRLSFGVERATVNGYVFTLGFTTILVP